ncbi:MAG: DUF3800 domain-containing protein [Oscillospiraceae bacterium]|jgi:hypothetical protein|nr:DUF3800 domain-containing protein [Oscillospiraceae bacterium]
MNTLFLDESNRTGTQKYDGKWNFEDQPYFSLCGILCPSENISQLDAAVMELRTLYHIQGNELKATKDSVKKNLTEIIPRLLKLQKQLECNLLAEVVNKKYCIAMMITDYCIFPYYDTPPKLYCTEDAAIVKRSFANYIYVSISDQLMGEFVSFFDSGNQNIPKLKALCLKLIDECKNQTTIDFINETIDSFTRFDDLGLLQRHVFPLIDFYNKEHTSSVAVSPHINSFNNIITRTRLHRLDIIHDNISELKPALEENLRLHNDVTATLKFANSKQTPGIQIADFWCGNINIAVQNILSNIDTVPKEIIDILQRHVNFVGPYTEGVKLFPDNPQISLEKKWFEDEFLS